MLTINIPVWLVVFLMGYIVGAASILTLGIWLGRRQRKPPSFTPEQVHDAFRRWCGLGQEFEPYTDQWWEGFETQLMGRNDG